MATLESRYNTKGCMNRHCGNTIVTVAARGFLAVALTLVVLGQAWGFGEGFASALCSSSMLKSIESVTGPLFPCGSIATTFRSEWGTGIVNAGVAGAKLTGSAADGTSFGQVDLRDAAHLETNAFLVDFYANLRLWRFGLRGGYAFHEARSRKIDFTKIDLSAYSVRGEFDLVQNCWLAVGPSVDYYFNDPRFEGSVQPVAPGPTYTVNVRGDRPIALGGYMRYVPPEIIGWPMHFEAWFKMPFKGAKLKSYGASFAFRPQIYRFDLCTRLIAEKKYLKFGKEPDSDYHHSGNLERQKWEVDTEWDFFGVEVAAYF
jgi:hypothetical protein